jgi:hypothetical protein
MVNAGFWYANEIDGKSDDKTLIPGTKLSIRQRLVCAVDD